MKSFIILMFFAITLMYHSKAVEWVSAHPIGAEIDESVIQAVVFVDASVRDRGNSSQSAPYPTIASGIAKAMENIERGIPTKVYIASGVYRESVGRLDFTKGKSYETLLIIEGEGPKETIWTGADVWSAQTWEAIGNGVYAHEWLFDWGNYSPIWGATEVIGHRSEMIFINNILQKQVLLEDYIYDRGGELTDHANRKANYLYKGVKDPIKSLEPGQFGVCERDDSGEWANKIFIRPSDESAFKNATIEVSTRQQLIFFGAKENLVLRGISFTKTASQLPPNGVMGPVLFNDYYWKGGSCNNVLIENCHFTWNSSTGLVISGRNWTVRNCEMSYNGYSGMAGSNIYDTLIEGNSTNFNNWRGHWAKQYDWFVGGVKFHETRNQLVRNHTSVGNITNGFWYDVQCENIRMEDVTFLLNQGHGIFIELSEGPFYIERMLSAKNNNKAFKMSIVGSFTLRDSILYSEAGGIHKLKNQQVPMPIVELLWYLRDDEHAQRKDFGPGKYLIENCVILGGTEVRGAIEEHNGIGRDNPKYLMYDYNGKNNIFFNQSGQCFFAYVSREWQAVITDLSGWQKYAREENPQWLDPLFVNPSELDFSLKEESPLRSETIVLPAKKVATDLLKETDNFFRWSEWQPTMSEIFHE